MSNSNNLLTPFDGALVGYMNTYLLFSTQMTHDLVFELIL